MLYDTEEKGACIKFQSCWSLGWKIIEFFVGTGGVGVFTQRVTYVLEVLESKILAASLNNYVSFGKLINHELSVL